MTANARFHLAFPVRDSGFAETRAFYRDLLGCREGRSSDRWVDFDFFGHQISAHLAPSEQDSESTNEVDGKQIPVRHFGAILDWEEWHRMAEKLKAAGATFVVDPYIRFRTRLGEQATMFLRDPSGNVLEFKAFRNEAMIFAA